MNPIDRSRGGIEEPVYAAVTEREHYYRRYDCSGFLAA